MFRRYSSGESVPAGTYLNRRTWEWVSVSENRGPLPGDGAAIYYRVPVLAALLVGPFIGLAFILFLPLAVPAVALYAAGRVAGRTLSRWRARGATAQASRALARR